MEKIKTHHVYITAAFLVVALLGLQFAMNAIKQSTISEFQMINVNKVTQAHNKMKNISKQYIEAAEKEGEFNQQIQMSLFSAITTEYSFVDYTEDYFSSRTYASQVDNLKDALFNYQKSLYAEDASEIENIQKALHELDTQYNIYIQNFK